MKARARGTWGELVRRLRAERGWTQGELAFRSSVDQSQISKIESGAQDDAYVSTVTKLADALGVGVEALLGRGRVAAPAPTAADTFPVSDLADAIYRRIVEQAGQGGQQQGKLAEGGSPSTDQKDEARPARRPAWRTGNGLATATG